MHDSEDEIRTASTHSEVDEAEPVESPDKEASPSDKDEPEPDLDEEHWKEIDLGNGVKMSKENYMKEWQAILDECKRALQEEQKRMENEKSTVIKEPAC